jgi:orotate phosphoribosyltransferase
MIREKEAIKNEFCRILKNINALVFGTFKLSRGRVTPYYVNLRLLPSFPDAFRMVSNFCIELINRTINTARIDRIAGIPITGMPLASVVAYHLRKPFLFIRVQAGLRGRERKVEGLLMPSEEVLLIDDLVATGHHLKNAARIIRSEGGVVKDAFVLLDREEGGRERLAEDKIKLHCLITISEASKNLYEMGVITEKELKIILKQVK